MSEDTSTVVDAAPVEAAVETDTTENAPKPGPASQFDEEQAQAKIKKVNSEAASLRARLKDAEAAAKELADIKDSQKTETQRLTDKLAAAEKARDELAESHTRFLAAAEFDVPADLIDFLGSGSEEDIRARAQLLSEKLRPAGNRPVESLSPGAAPKSDTATGDPNAWLRRAAGYE